MGNKTERINGKRIVVLKLTPPLDSQRDPVEGTEEFMRMYDENGTWVRILDFTDVEVNFGDVAMGLQEDQAMRLPNVHSFLVGTDELVAFAAQAAQQEMYGNLKTRAFTSLDEALRAAHEVAD